MRPTPLRTWLWQLSYAAFGLCFFIGLILSVFSWGTSTFFWWIGFAIASIVLLLVLNRVFHGRRHRPKRDANIPIIAADSTDSSKVP